MSKLAKFLILVVLSAVLISSFWIVSFAEGSNAVCVTDQNYNNKSGNISNDAAKLGKAVAVKQDNNNVYMLLTYDAATGTNAEDVSTYHPGGYLLTDYPYVCFSFDIMSPQGVHSSNTYLELRPYLDGVAKSYFTNKIYFNKLGLSSEPYEWQHISIVVAEDPDTSTFTQYVYVNGVEKVRYTESGTSAIKITDDNRELLQVRVSNFKTPKNEAQKSQETAIDNFKCTYFKMPTTDNPMDSIPIMANHYYNYGNYTFPYKYTIATVTDGEGNVSYYDDFAKALDDAESNSVIELMSDVNVPVVIDKKTTIISNGKSMKNISVAEGFAIKVENGVYTYDTADSAIEVVWDPDCGNDNCECNHGMGHANTASMLLLDGSEFSYAGTVCTSANGVIADFLGWSYTENATAPENITHIDATKATDGVINLYPVYTNIVKYAVEVKLSGGEVRYFNDFSEAFSTAIAQYDSTIILHSDIELQDKTFSVSKPLKIDLNGKTIKYVSYHGNFYEATYNEATGEYTYGTTKIKSTDRYANWMLFKVSASDVSLDITSSRLGATVYAANANANIYTTADGTVAKRDIINYRPYAFVCIPSGIKNTDLSISNLTLYTQTIVYQSDSKVNYNIDIDNIIYNRMNHSDGSSYGDSHTFVLLSDYNATLNVTNSQFYSSYDSNAHFLRIGSSGTAGYVGNYTFTNCDIVKSGSGYEHKIQNNRSNTASIVFNDSRVYDFGAIDKPVQHGTAGEKTLSFYKESGGESSPVPVALDGLVNKTTSVSILYYLPASNVFTTNTDSAIEYPNFSYGTVEKTITFNTLTTKAVTINWMVGEDTYKTETVYPGVTKLTLPAYGFDIEGDYYRDALCEWKDSEGNVIVADSIVGWDDTKYTFYANRKTGNDIEYIAGVDAMFNFSYYTNFTTILYLPIEANVEAPTVSGFDEEYTKVKIDGVEYWAYSRRNNTTTVSEDFVTIVTFTKEGVEYTQNFTLSALLYAQIVLNEPVNEVEKTAVANMLRYIKEARLASSLDAGEEFDELIALGNLADLGTKNDYVDTSVDYSTLTGYVYSVKFIVSNTDASYVITMTDEAVIQGATINVSYLGGADIEITASKEEIDGEKITKYTTSKTKVYDIAEKAIKITVSIPNSEGGEPTVISGTYSVKAYINATDNTLAKAMYEFGIATKAYRDYLVENS